MLIVNSQILSEAVLTVECLFVLLIIMVELQ